VCARGERWWAVRKGGIRDGEGPKAGGSKGKHLLTVVLVVAPVGVGERGVAR